MADERDGALRAVEILVRQLSFHQEEYHKVNGRAVTVLLGAGAAAVGLAIKERGELHGVWSSGQSCGLFIAAGATILGVVLLAIALFVHSSGRTSIQKRIELRIARLANSTELKASDLNLPETSTDESSKPLFDAQPDAGRANVLFFAGTTCLILAMALLAGTIVIAPVAALGPCKETASSPVP